MLIIDCVNEQNGDNTVLPILLTPTLLSISIQISCSDVGDNVMLLDYSVD